MAKTSSGTASSSAAIVAMAPGCEKTALASRKRKWVASGWSRTKRRRVSPCELCLVWVVKPDGTTGTPTPAA
jgi:hypothetical protein